MVKKRISGTSAIAEETMGMIQELCDMAGYGIHLTVSRLKFIVIEGEIRVSAILRASVLCSGEATNPVRIIVVV